MGVSTSSRLSALSSSLVSTLQSLGVPGGVPGYVKNRRRYTAVLPPAGPAWAGSLMGTALTSALLEIHGFAAGARAMLLIAGAVTIIITIGWLVYRSPKFTPVVMPAWAMVSLGLVSLGSASSTILADSLGDAVWWFHFGCCVIGGVLGLVTYVVYLRQLITGRAGTPTFSWGLPLVTPMVTATAGMRFHDWLVGTDVSGAPGADGAHEVWTTLILVLSMGAFLLTLLTAPVVFTRVYAYYLGPRSRRASHHRLEPMAAPTIWIPLGIVGQSMACAQLFGAATGWVRTGVAYGFIMCVVAIPVTLTAVVVHYQAALRGISYSPTWWASTFPVGALCLGVHWLSDSSGLGWLDQISVFLLVILLFHAGVATLGGTMAIIARMARRLRAVTGGRRR
ncbi:conserved hypothetical protein [Corynebacterium efficiens YS-314]|uniref:Uncharacterized protein n=1 Tax=Corynebacterium efficiens (strain DSM 44549 / YS-314 / AJ 12310 / JCM 11189 / NBRC 100395) TaxID=196164 RepID=Q8FM12_COREF|nr:conserved hypothetical protein [Corynebacterium efficiens YS-314]